MAIVQLVDTRATIIFQQKLSKLVNYTRSYKHFCAKKSFEKTAFLCLYVHYSIKVPPSSIKCKYLLT